MTQSGGIYTFGPFRVDVATRTLARQGEAVTLTSKAFDTLLVLVQNRDRLVEKDELVKSVWPDTFVSDDSLTHSISVLRRALGDDSGQPVYIATVPRRGYRFTSSVHVERAGSAATVATFPQVDVSAPALHAVSDERSHHLLQLISLGRAFADIERLIRADADRRQSLGDARDRAREKRIV